LRWTAVTIDGGDNARAALDRITIPQEVLERIAPTAVARSSIVISDEPLHRETNYRTEFVVALHDQPQGGLAMRKRPPRFAPRAVTTAPIAGAIGTPGAAANTTISGKRRVFLSAAVVKRDVRLAAGKRWRALRYLGMRARLARWIIRG